MFLLRRAALAGAATWWAALSAWEPAFAAEPEPAEIADALDRPVKGLFPRDSWRRMCEAVGRQIKLPVEFDGPALQTVGVSGPPSIAPPPDGTPGGAALWHCTIALGVPEVVFVVHRDAAGAATKVEFTSIQAAEKAGARLPYEARFLPGIVPFLDPKKHDIKPDLALRALARFGAEAEGAIPKIEAYAWPENRRDHERRQAEWTIQQIRKAVEAKAKRP